MNKKTLIIVALCALGLCFGEAQAVNKAPTPITINNWEIADPPQGFEEIKLQGTLMLGVGPNAVVAGASDNSVYIGFNQDFGNVSISIYNAAGLLVCSTVVNTNVQPTVIIPFENVNTGVYTVVLDNADGGDFERH